jgi:hypothetical protein
MKHLVDFIFTISRDIPTLLGQERISSRSNATCR